MRSSWLFMAATSFANLSSARMVADLAATEDFTDRLTLLLHQLRETAKCDLIVLDCHGGLDYLSSTAHKLSDRTVVVTEADTVTFNGTLELLSFYVGTRSDGVPNVGREFGSTYPLPPQFVVNRVLPKYNFDDLDHVYQGLLRTYGAELNVTPEVLCYIPDEDFVSESFGEYPFCVELVPNSVFSKKVHLLVFKLTKGIAGNDDIGRKLRSESFRLKVERCLISDSQRSIRLMVRTFVLFTVLLASYALAIPAGIVLALRRWELLQVAKLFRSPLVLVPALVLSLWILVTLFRALLGASRYYSDQYRFRRLLWTRDHRKPSLGERVILLRLLFMRTVIPISVVMCGLTAVGLTFDVVLVLVYLRRLP